MTEPRVKRSRHRAAERQNYRCYYCAFPMWEHDAARFASQHHISLAEARRFFCTAEHLRALCDGGTSRGDNIVAACQFCNRTRHARNARLSSDQFVAWVTRRVARQAWHPPWLHRMRLA